MSRVPLAEQTLNDPFDDGEYHLDIGREADPDDVVDIHHAPALDRLAQLEHNRPSDNLEGCRGAGPPELAAKMVDDEVTRHLVGHQADVTAAEVDEVERTPQIHLPEYPREWVTGGPCAIVRHKVVDHLCDVGDGWVLDSTPLCVARLLDGLVVEAEVARTRRGCVGGRAALLLAVLGGPPEWGQVGPRDGQSGGLGQDEGQAGAMELLHLHSVDCTGGRLI